MGLVGLKSTTPYTRGSPRGKSGKVPPRPTPSPIRIEPSNSNSTFEFEFNLQVFQARHMKPHMQPSNSHAAFEFEFEFNLRIRIQPWITQDHKSTLRIKKVGLVGLKVKTPLRRPPRVGNCGKVPHQPHPSPFRIQSATFEFEFNLRIRIQPSNSICNL